MTASLFSVANAHDDSNNVGMAVYTLLKLQWSSNRYAETLNPWTLRTLVLFLTLSITPYAVYETAVYLLVV